MNNEYVIALYLRLSQEDESYGESESISNQRDLLNEFVQSNTELNGCKVIEFVDDGYSGTNFNRPDVTKMLDAVKDGDINCIIVKDFSRFGRNFIEVGDYIEQIFPFLGVRFISVNNGFDSKNFSSAGSLEIAFKNLINELYSKDISKKVKTAKKAKMQKGDFMSSQAPFGYAKSPECKNQLIIDPVSSEYVKLIFDLCISGNGTTAIANKLNNANIPTPLCYKRSIGQGRKWNIVGEENIWTRASVLKILRDERYTGKYVGGKRKTAKVGSRKSVKVPKDDWIVIEGNHTPIVSEETFLQAGEIIGAKGERDAISRIEHLLAKKVFCGHCKHVMRRRNRDNSYFYCDTPRYIDSQCYTDKIDEKFILDILLYAIKKHTELAFSMTELLNSIEQKNEMQKAKIKQELASLKEQFERVRLTKIELYESYKDGTLSKDSYLIEKAKLESSLTSIQNAIEKAEFSIKENNGRTSNGYIDTFSKYQTSSELSKQMIDDLVAAVYIYDIEKIEIVWNFADEYKRAVRLIAEQIAVS